MLDKVERRIKCIYSIECKRGEFLAAEMEPNVKKVGNELLYLLKNAGEIVCVDLNTLECGQYVEDFRFDDQERKHVYNVLMDRGALLYEEPGKVDLNTLLRYCIDCNEET
ncbi:MAG: hypothetical protein K2K19_06470 [Acetatifactor sp.]|nr:hypothetical protein [Acetatifactor sp.]